MSAAHGPYDPNGDESSADAIRSALYRSDEGEHDYEEVGDPPWSEDIDSELTSPRNTTLDDVDRGTVAALDGVGEDRWIVGDTFVMIDGTDTYNLDDL